MTETKNNLLQALDQVLETMAFLAILPVDENMIIPDQTILGEIKFKGPKSGTIRILTGPECAEVLAENIGAIEDVDDNIRFDAVKELTNVTCGLILPLLTNSQEDTFDITVPTVKSGQNAPAWNEFTNRQDTCISNIEGYALASQVTIETQQKTGETS